MHFIISVWWVSVVHAIMIFEHSDLKPRNPYLGLALDEAICLHLAAKKFSAPFRAGFRFWASPYAVILGRTCKPEQVLHPNSLFKASLSLNKAEPMKLPLCRRLSGGGTVMHGPGNLNYSIFLSLSAFPKMFSLRRSYEYLLSFVCEALEAQGIACSLAGQSDIALRDSTGKLSKISGTAQFRRRGVLVLHGTLIVRPELLSKIEEYLSHPPKEPSYRMQRSHSDFLGCLPETFDFACFYRCFSQKFKNFCDGHTQISFNGDDRHSIYAQARELAIQNYKHREWIIEGCLPKAQLSMNIRTQRKTPKDVQETL